MTFRADYPPAIVVEAKNYGYIINNNPKGFVYHTPEEDADDDPQTPGYLANITRLASYTYFVSYLGFVFQFVPERHGAYANGIVDKGYPSWAQPNLPPPAGNLNLQCISISFEGHAATIHRTMVRGRSQWNAGVDLVAHRAKRLRISPDNWTRHADVYTQRSDPGSLDLVQFTLDVKAKMQPQEDDMDKAEVEAIVRAMKFRARASDGTALTDPHLLERWLGSYHEHRQDSDKHSAGESHTHTVPAHRTEEA